MVYAPTGLLKEEIHFLLRASIKLVHLKLDRWKVRLFSMYWTVTLMLLSFTTGNSPRYKWNTEWVYLDYIMIGWINSTRIVILQLEFQTENIIHLYSREIWNLMIDVHQSIMKDLSFMILDVSKLKPERETFEDIYFYLL